MCEMDETTKNYELAILAASEQDYQDALQALRASQIEMSAEAQPAKIKLAYPIKKENFGYFCNVCFSAAAEEIEKINKILRGNLKILRFSVFNKPVIKEKEREGKKTERTIKRPAEPEKTWDYNLRQAPIEKTGALSNEALEKKLEEILK